MTAATYAIVFLSMKWCEMRFSARPPAKCANEKTDQRSPSSAQTQTEYHLNSMNPNLRPNNDSAAATEIDDSDYECFLSNSPCLRLASLSLKFYDFLANAAAIESFVSNVKWPENNIHLAKQRFESAILSFRIVFWGDHWHRNNRLILGRSPLLLFSVAAIDFFSYATHAHRASAYFQDTNRVSVIPTFTNRSEFVRRKYCMQFCEGMQNVAKFTKPTTGDWQWKVPSFSILKEKKWNISFVYNISHLRRSGWLAFVCCSAKTISYYYSPPRTMEILWQAPWINACDTKQLACQWLYTVHCAVSKQKRTTEKCVSYYHDGHPKNYLNYTN